MMNKRILSFLLALLLVVGMLPAPAYATDSTEATTEPTTAETTVETTAAVTEPTVPETTAAATEPTTAATEAVVEETVNFALTAPVMAAAAEDYSADVGKYVKLNEAVTSFSVYSMDQTAIYSYFHDDFTDDTIFRIAQWKVDENGLWYQVEFYTGATQGDFVADFPAEPWFLQTGDALLFLTTCDTCGKPDCPGHTQPENPCACCDTCTGAEGCECQCGACNFCEKEEEPSEPVYTDRETGVVVELESLVEGVKLEVSEADVSAQLNSFGIPAEKKIFGLDISLSVEGEEYQPEAALVKIPVSAPAGTLIGILHTHGSKTTFIGMTEVLSDGTVEFVTDGFSEFAGFTVDFHYNDVDFSIEGMTSILLSDLFEAMGIDENAYEAESVVFSNDSLVYPEKQDNGDWLLTSLEAFQTEETLIITFSDGHTIVIDVTDEIRVDETTPDGEKSHYMYLFDSGPNKAFNTHGIMVWYNNDWLIDGTEKITMRLTLPNGTTLNDTAENFVLWPTYLKLNLRSDGRYWFFISDYGKVNIDDTDDYENYEVQPAFLSAAKNRYINFEAKKADIDLNNAAAALCSVRIAPKTSTSQENRTVEIWLNGQRLDSKTQAFPSRDSSLHTGYYFTDYSVSSSADIHVTFKDNNRYRFTGVSVNQSTKTYRLDFYDYKYQLNYDSNGGSDVAAQEAGPKSATSHAFMVTSTTPTRNGYKFLGWADSASATSAQYSAGGSVTINAGGNSSNGNPYVTSKTVYAVWKAIPSVTIHHYLQGTTTQVADDTVVALPYNQSVTVADYKKTITNYEYVSCSPTSFTVGETAAGNTATIYYKNITKYTVTWKNGSTTLETDTVTHGGSATYNGSTPTKTTDGYIHTFSGWDQGTNGTVSNVTSNLTVNAGFTSTPISYSVSFNGNGATSGSMDNQSFTFDTAQNLTANSYKREYIVTYDTDGGNDISPATAAATFNGWEDRGSIVYQGVTWNYTDFDAPYYGKNSTDVFNHAQFGNGHYNKYGLLKHYVLHGQGEWNNGAGSTSRAPTGSTPGLYPNQAKVSNLSTTNGANGATVPLYANWTLGSVNLPTPAKEGYSFNGWTDGTTVYSGGATYTPKANVTLTAQWAPNTDATYTVHYYYEGTTNEVATSKIVSNLTFGEECTETAISLTGYDLVGSNTQTVTAGYEDNEIIFYYKGKTYTLTVYATYGAPNKSSQHTVTFGRPDNNNLGQLETIIYTPNGKQLKGLYTASNSGGTQVYGSDGKHIPGTDYWDEDGNWNYAGNLTVYADWEDVEYTITFVNILTGEETQKQYTTFGTAVTLGSLTHQGYDFKGWLVKEPVGNWNTETLYSSDHTTAGAYGNVTLEAHWTPISYTITYDLAGGTLPEGSTNPVTYTIESDAITLINPTRDGYTFTGWTVTGIEGSAAMEIIIPQGSTGDRSYTATWELAQADLTVVTENVTSGQSYVITVSGADAANSGVSVRIIHMGNETTVIKNLPVGNYNITVNGDWTWREKFSDSQVQLNESKAVTIGRSINDSLIYWLNGYSN